MAVQVAPAPSQTREVIRRLARNPIALVSAIYIALLVVVAIFAPLISPYLYDQTDSPSVIILAPSGGRHLLGTDNMGLDIFSRVLYGARVSLAVGVVVVAIEAFIGISFGLIAAWKGGWWDTILMRLTDAMFAFPDLLFAILLVAILNPTTVTGTLLTVFVALALVGWPSMARLVRGQALALREKEYVEAARALGAGGWWIGVRHLLPNMLSPIIVAATIDLAGMIMAEATLSFLGIGIQPPYPSWGRMISDGRNYMRSSPGLILCPALALAITVMAFNFLGDALRDALDPRMRE